MKKVTTALLGAMLLLPPLAAYAQEANQQLPNNGFEENWVIAHPGQLATIKKQTVQLLSPGAYPKS